MIQINLVFLSISIGFNHFQSLIAPPILGLNILNHFQTWLFSITVRLRRCWSLSSNIEKVCLLYYEGKCMNFRIEFVEKVVWNVNLSSPFEIVDNFSNVSFIVIMIFTMKEGVFTDLINFEEKSFDPITWVFIFNLSSSQLCSKLWFDPIWSNLMHFGLDRFLVLIMLLFFW